MAANIHSDPGIQDREVRWNYRDDGDVFYANQTPSLATLLGDISTGYGAARVMGWKANVERIEFRARARMSTFPRVSTCRLILFFDRQSNGGLPVVYGENGLLQLNDPVSPRTMEGYDRYGVVYDSGPFQIIGGFTTADSYNSASGWVCNFDELVSEPFTITPESEPPGNVASNNLWVVLLGDGVLVPDDAPRFDWLSRVWYSDEV